MLPWLQQVLFSKFGNGKSTASGIKQKAEYTNIKRLPINPLLTELQINQTFPINFWK